MSYVPKPNTGALFVAEKKTELWPDRTGSVYLSRDLIKSLLAQPDPLVKMAISGWLKEANGKKYLSLTVGEPYLKKDAPKVEPEDENQDMPF